MSVALEMPDLPPDDLVQAALARRSLHEFVKQAWHVLEPSTPFVDNWHIKAICDHLEAVTEGRVQNLLINIPPGHMKSMLVCVFWPCWVWLKSPGKRWLFWSYAEDLAIRDSRKCRALIMSDWYQKTFRPKWKLTQDSDAYLANDATGFRQAAGMKGGSTGHRGDYVVVDDPLSVKDANSDLVRAECLRLWDEAIANRLSDPVTGARVIIMQRLHEEDLSGHVLAEGKWGNWQHLCLPSRFDPSNKSRTTLGIKMVNGKTVIRQFEDPRKEDCELLFPAKFPKSAIDYEEFRLRPAAFAGQHQQRPNPAGGGQFKEAWIRWYTEEQDHYVLHDPERGDRRVMKCDIDDRYGVGDLAMSLKETADYAALLSVATTLDHDILLLDLLRQRLEHPDIGPAIKSMMIKRSLRRFYIEKKQNGTAVVQQFVRDGVAILGLEADGDKVTRSGQSAIKMENGHFYFPKPEVAPWVLILIAELMAFPNGAHDDTVDVFSYVGIVDGDHLEPIDGLGLVTTGAL